MKPMKAPEIDDEQIVLDSVSKILADENYTVDSEFIANLLYQGADALDEYELTGPERLAVLTGDIEWIEEQIGPLTPTQKKWLEQRLSADIW